MPDASRRSVPASASTASGGRERRMLDGPGPETFAALPDADEAVLADPGYRRAAGVIARTIDAPPPVATAVGVLEAIAGRADSAA
jgi:hypothetical protein